MIYYNEFDEPTAWWLKGLSDNGVIPKGFVDTRSIVEVDPDELKQYTQCHFFAGIGGWAYALMLAGVPKDLNVYTGSCPCQPFSNAGAKRGFEDERNLWKVFYEIIDRNRPSVVLGEQVDAAIRFGWLDVVCDDLESSGYSTGSSVLTASMLGSPHTRRRLYWGGVQKDVLENSDGIRLKWWLSMGSEGGCSKELQSHNQEFLSSNECFWDDGVWQEGTNGKSYLFQPRDFPLVNGVPNRVLKCRGYGNAIVPQVGSFFTRALLGI
jgi:DNA (cytosine-5)-methyltransferase 1